MKSWEIPGIPDYDIIVSEKRHVLTRKTRRRGISSNYLCKKEQPCWKTEKLPHLRISNSIYEAMVAYFLKYLRYEHIVVVLRCLPSVETVGLAILKKKSEGDMGPGPMGEWVYIYKCQIISIYCPSSPS